MNDELKQRYQNDLVFHVLVEGIVSSVIDGKLNRNDWFDAIQVADQIISVRELHKAMYAEATK